MVKPGRMNKLTIVEQMDFGLLLDGGHQYGRILLPNRYVPEQWQLGDELDVFIYFDSNDIIIATTETPKGQVGDFVSLRCISVNEVGAFLDWGLMKDLLVPYSEQRVPMQVDRYYVVHIYQDRASSRLVASTKLNRFINEETDQYKFNQKVDILLAERTDLGYKAIINNHDWGLLYLTESYGELSIGKRLSAFIKQIRDDGLIDLALQKQGRDKVSDLSDKILQTLSRKQGFVPLTDKSTPDEIFEWFRTSKNTFKQAIGSLYKQRLIRLEHDGIYLVE